MRTFAQIIADEADNSAPRSTNRAKLREMFNRLFFDSTPVVSNVASRAVLYPTPIGDEKVLNKLTDEIERYDSAALAWNKATRRRSMLLGIEEPNPGIARLMNLPTTMASPPTITQGVADAASTISGAIFTPSTKVSGSAYILNPDAPWRYRGGNASVKSQTFPDELFVVPNNVPSVDPQGIGNLAIEFEFDGQTFDFKLKGVGNGQWYRILVDGQYANGLYGQAGPTATGSGYLIKVAFSSRALRRIRIEFSTSCHFSGMNVGPNDTLWPSSVPVGPKVIVMGDSFSEGAIGWSSLSAWWDTMGKALGWRDVQSSAMGGTGFLNPGTHTTFRARVVTDVLAFKPDVLVVAGGINDVSLGLQPGLLQAEVTSLFAQVRAALPAVKLIVLGPWWPNGAPTSATLPIRDEIKAACLADTGPHLFIDNIVATTPGSNRLGWMTGTGRVGATAGDGNADLYTDTDGTHPTQVGQDYLGRRAATAIATGMPF